jgi:hypothetical protein
MNFTPDGNGRAIAENIPVGHRSLVYEMAPSQRFTRAIEITGDVAQGQQAFDDYHLSPDALNTIDPKWFKIFRPIRILAEVDCVRSPSLTEILRVTNFEFKPVGFGMQYIEKKTCFDIFNAIKWDCVRDDADSAEGRMGQ